MRNFKYWEHGYTITRWKGGCDIFKASYKGKRISDEGFLCKISAQCAIEKHFKEKQEKEVPAK